MSVVVMENKQREVNGKNIVITGATSGIGKATALLLAQKGANIFVISRSQEKVNQVVKELKEKNPEGKMGGAVADVGDYYEMESAFEEADKLFSKIDVLVNNASAPARSILNTSPDDWQGIIQTNVVGYMNGFYLAIERMMKEKEGHIVVTASQSIKYKDPEADLYVSTKTAIDGFVESLAPVIKDLGIKVTKVHPGNVATGMISETGKKREDMIKKGKLLESEKVAEVIVFAISQPQPVNIDEITISPFKRQ